MGSESNKDCVHLVVAYNLIHGSNNLPKVCYFLDRNLAKVKPVPTIIMLTMIEFKNFNHIPFT